MTVTRFVILPRLREEVLSHAFAMTALYSLSLAVIFRALVFPWSSGL
jgi:hypothetical protein